jgi:hypothetical protein
VRAGAEDFISTEEGPSDRRQEITAQLVLFANQNYNYEVKGMMWAERVAQKVPSPLS